MTFMETTILKQVQVPDHGRLAEAVKGRSRIFAMSQAAEDAVLRPRDTGAFAHDLRAALAARIARAATDDALAGYFAARAGNMIDIADPAADVPAELAPVLDFVDKVANQTRDVAAGDITALQAAGMSDADIVRLCELVAFVAFQARVIAGLRLMESAAP